MDGLIREAQTRIHMKKFQTTAYGNENSSVAVITAAERQRRYEASEFAKASMALEGFVRSKEAQAHADRFINGEIDSKAYFGASYQEVHGHQK